jgi:hypothetical protein
MLIRPAWQIGQHSLPASTRVARVGFIRTMSLSWEAMPLAMSASPINSAAIS